MVKPETAVSATPLLFGEWPEQTVLERRVKQFIFTGKIALKDKERCDAIVVDWYSLSLEAIARKHAVSPTTVKVIVEAYREAGKLGEFKERSARRLGTIIELAEHRLIEKLEAGQVPANVLPIVLGVCHDKKGQLEAGLVPGTSRAVEEVGLERYAAMLEAARLRARAAVESESDVGRLVSGLSGGNGALETAQETPADGRVAGGDGGQAAAAAVPGPEAAEGGGGV